MSRIIMLIPTGTGVGLISVSLGIIHAMEYKDVRLSVFKPVARPRTGGGASDQTATIMRANSSTTAAVESLKVSYVEGLPSNNQKDMLMREIIADYHANTKGVKIVLARGLVPIRKHQFAQSLNYEIAKTLNAEIAFVMSQGTDTLEQLRERIKLACGSSGGTKNTNTTGIIVSKLNAPVDEQGRTRPDLSEIFDDSTKAKVNNVDPAKLQESSLLLVLGVVPWSFNLIATHAIDVVHHLNATIINKGDINARHVKSVASCAHGIPHMLEHSRVGSLLVTFTGHPDVLVTAYLVAMNGVEIGALSLTGGYEADVRISRLCERAFVTGLSVFMVNTNTWQTSLSLQSFNLEVPADNRERIERVQKYVANYINTDWIDSLTATFEHSRHLSLSAFRYQLTELARKTDKRIVLLEGDEPRTVKAAAIYAERGTATCVPLGNPAEVNRVAASQDVELSAGTEIVDPEVVRENYVGRLVELYKNKGMTETVVREQLEDNVILGTLMLEQDEVSGLVSGAVRTTANTIRPPLQPTKTASGSSLVSSVSFILSSEQIYVYDDCAINLDPTAEQLAEIAVRSADSAAAFGTEPCVAMLSYSTGTPGTGSSVEKARETTRLVQEKRPGLIIGGPLQYGIAVIVDIVKSKVPNSPVAGHAIVFVFPDLNTGNATCKAIQRSADLISIGPMLQGIHRPVNNPSHGTLVDDIVYTIALTAIQSAQQQ